MMFTKPWNAKVLMAIWLSALVVILLPFRTSAVANFSYNTAVTYKVEENDTTNVTENYTITNNTPRLYLSELKLTTPSAGITNLRVNYEGGESIPASATKQKSSRGDLDFESSEINIKFPKQIFGEGKKWSFSVNYSTKGLAESRGGSHTVFIPSIDPAEGTENYSVRLEVPVSFGNPHFSGAKASQSGLENGQQFFIFGRNEVVNKSLALGFGDVNRYKLNFNFPLHNNSPFPRTLSVALPPDLNNQKVFINSLSPKPTNTRLDADGNILADYRMEAGQKFSVTTDIVGEVKYRDYDLTKSGYKKDIPADLIKKYTGSTSYWPTGGSVGSEAAKLSNDQRPVSANVKAMYDFVIQKLNYNNEKIKFNIRQGADKALANPSNAVCLEYADLLIAMLRSQGIPARMPVGYSYSGNLKESDAVADSLHSWVEAYVPGVGWMTLDPTWGEKFDEFGKSDLEHFAFTVWGREDDIPTAIMAGNQDLNYQYEKAILTYVPVLQVPKTPASLKISRYAIFPGIAWDEIEVVTPAGGVTDGNYVNVDGVKHKLGSLAPAQKVNTKRLLLGMRWSSADTAKFERQDGGQILILAQAKTKVNFWPLGASAIITIGAVGLFVSIRRRNRGTNVI